MKPFILFLALYFLGTATDGFRNPVTIILPILVGAVGASWGSKLCLWAAKEGK